MGADVQAERYRVRSTLGAGGMGQVVLAQDVVLGRDVALKRLHASAARQSTARFRREARVGASLSHPNLVSIYDIVEDGEDLVIVMEYIEGETLRQALRRSRLPPQRALGVLDSVASGLDHAHSHGVVHRDVKPANVLLGLDGAIKLADLGVAAAADRTRITTSGALIGTIPYMAPEQLEGAEAAPEADVYALAAVAFETLSGRRARPEENPLALAHAVATEPPPDLLEAWPDAPPEAAAVLAAGMAREPERRPRSAGELVARLRESLDPRGTVAATGAARARRREARTPPPPPPAPELPSEHPPRRSAPAPLSAPARRRRLPGAAAAAALLAVAAVAAVLIAASGGSSSKPRRAVAHTGAGPHHATSSAAAATSAPAQGPATGSAPAPPAPAPSSGAARAGNPAQAVESFYTLAAAHRYAQAWQLADPSFRAQLAGFNAFANQQSHVSSIRFDRASAVSQTPTTATVAVQTTPVVDGATQHCHGTVALQRAGTGPWLLHNISINC